MRKKWIRLIAAAVGSFLLAGCGADTQIDDYAINDGAESVQQTAGTESAATTTATEGIPKDRDQGGGAPSVRPGRRKRIHVHA